MKETTMAALISLGVLGLIAFAVHTCSATQRACVEAGNPPHECERLTK